MSQYRVSDVETDPELSGVIVLKFDAPQAEIPNERSPSSNALIATQTREYGDHSFINWQYEYSKFEAFKEMHLFTSFWHRFREPCLRWIALILCSVLTALVTIFIDYISTYINNLKFGLCKSAFYRVRSHCVKNWENWGSMIVSNYHVAQVLNWLFTTLASAFLILVAYRIAVIYVKVGESGILEMKMYISGLVIRGILSFRTTVCKIFSLLLVIASGLWLGYEGPLVHIACSFISTAMTLLQRFSNTFNNEAMKRELISCGFSIGIAFAFSAPIGGVLFGLEQIQSYFPVQKLMWNSFICTTIGVTILEKLNSLRDLSVSDSFNIDLKNNWLFFEGFIYLILGILCGGLGILFNRLNISFSRFRNRMVQSNKAFKITEVLLITIITSSIGFILASSHYTLNEMLRFLYTDCFEDNNNNNPFCSLDSGTGFPLRSLGSLLLLTFESFLLTSYTYGISLPGGVLLPSLVIGAIIGRLVGVFMEYIQYNLQGSTAFLRCYNEKTFCVSAASYAVVGSASFFAAVTKMSIASVVIVSEITGALNYIIPIMIGVFCARSINALFLDKSLYELTLIHRGEPYLPSYLENGTTISGLSMMTASQLMIPTDNLPVLYGESTTALSRLENLPHSPVGYPIIKSNANPILFGYITSDQLTHELKRFKESEMTEPDTIISLLTPMGNSIYSAIDKRESLFIVTPNVSLLTVYEVMGKMKICNLFVCQCENGKFLGIVTKQDLINLIQSGDRTLRRGL